MTIRLIRKIFFITETNINKKIDILLEISFYYMTQLLILAIKFELILLT